MIPNSEKPSTKWPTPSSSQSTDLQSCVDLLVKGLRPDQPLTVSEWADRYRFLSGKAASEPGPWRTSRTPYLREVMDCLSSSDPTEEVVVVKGSQLGFTEAGNNWLGYIIDHAPGPILSVQPTVETAKRGSKQRIDPLIESTPALKKLVKNSRSRDSGNTILSKEFPGGILIMTGANSAVGLRSMPVRYLFLDEIDAYPGDVDGEGDPLDLAHARTRTFSRRKIFEPSTPTIEGLSKVEARFNDSDRRYFWLPCPHCQQFQKLIFDRLKWDAGKPAGVYYKCEHCDGAIYNHHKTEMLERGEWRKEAPENRVAGFHLSSLYSPVGWFSWEDIARKWEEAQGNRNKLQVFINTILGECWTNPGDAPEWKRLYDRREKYKIGRVPHGVLFLTGSGDVQKDRVEVKIVGWGRGKQNWTVDRIVLDGDPYRKEVWEKVTELISGTWPSEYGKNVSLSRFAIDSGYATQEVYAWARKQPPGRVIVVKGHDRFAAAPVSSPTAAEVNVGGKKIARGIKVWPVASGILKSELYGWLNLECPTVESGDPFPPGYCHHPEFDEEFFRQLTAEKLVPRFVKGYRKLEWEKTRERNEALDLWVYARAAAAVVGLDRMQEHHWAKLEADLGVAPLLPSQNPKPVESLPRPAPTPAPVAPIAQHRPSGWLGGNRSGWLNKR